MQRSFNRSVLVLLCFAQLINLVYAHQNTISRTVTDAQGFERLSIMRNANDEPTIDDLCKPVVFSPSGITCYFKHIYNHEKYAQEVLPELPFTHFEQFMEHGIKSKQPRSYIKAVFRLFEKKFKAAPYINATEIEPFLNKLPELLKNYITPVDTAKKQMIKQIIRTEMETNFEALKQNPDAFLDTLAEKIVSAQATCAEVSSEQLQFAVTKFIDTCLNKVIWSPSDKDDVWVTFISLGKHLSALKEQGILRTADDLDDCLWTLTTRFCTFLSLSGSELPMSFYEKAREDIHRGIPHLDNVEEQEDLIDTKRVCLQETVIRSAARAYAKGTFGILSDSAVKTTEV